MSREDEIRKQAAIIKKRFRELAGIPDLSDPENVKKIGLEIEQKIEKEKNNAEEYLKEISSGEPHLIEDGYFNFTKNFSEYAKLKYYLADDENKKTNFYESVDIDVSPQLNKSLKKLKEEITKLAKVYSYQIVKKDKGMLHINSEDFDWDYENSRGRTIEESIAREFLLSGEGHQITTFHEAEEKNSESIPLIVDLIDKYIAGDYEKEVAEAIEATKRRNNTGVDTFASLRSIREVKKQIEKENNLARKMRRLDLLKSEEEIQFYTWLRTMRGNIFQGDNSYRRKHFYISAYLGESFVKDSLWEQEGMNHIFVEIILKKWRELHPNDISLTLNNYYRSLFASAVFHNQSGHELIDNLKKDLFGRWAFRPGQVKRSTVWSLLQDCLDRSKVQCGIKTLPEKINESQRQKIINKFGYRDWLVYKFRKDEGYSLRSTIKEIHRRKFKISKKNIDPIVARIDGWLK